MASLGLIGGITDPEEIEAVKNHIPQPREDFKPDKRWPQWMLSRCDQGELPYRCLNGLDKCREATFCLHERLKVYAGGIQIAV